jgi:hypothetical protein
VSLVKRTDTNPVNAVNDPFLGLWSQDIMPSGEYEVCRKRVSSSELGTLIRVWLGDGDDGAAGGARD